jgi:hypothetical protein
MIKSEKIKQDSEKIKSILQDIKIDLAVELDRVKPQTNYKEKTDQLWKEFHNEEKQALTHPIYNNIEHKRQKADHGMYFSKIIYTPDEENFLKSNPHVKKMDKLIDQVNKIEDDEKKQLKQRLKTNTAPIEEKKQLENVEFTIWNSGKELLGTEEGTDLPAFSVDSDFYHVFNDDDGMYSLIYKETNCKLRQKLNQLGYDYESYSHVDKIIHPIDTKVTKDKFLDQHTYCKKWFKETKKSKKDE